MDKNFYEKCAKFLNVVLPQFITKVWDEDGQLQLRIENTTSIYWLTIERGGIKFGDAKTFLLSKEIYVEGTHDYPPDTDIHDVAELKSIYEVALFIASGKKLRYFTS